METTDVLVAGAGPTGLVLTLWLAKSGIRVRIIDKNSQPGEYSRAIAVQARTLEFYHQLGIADEIVAAGIQVMQFTMRENGRVKAKAQFADAGKGLSPFPCLLMLAQDDHEKILVAQLKKLGIEVERNVTLQSFTQENNHVNVQLKTANNTIETIQAQYLCGCDGAHSTVREISAIPFPGGMYDHMFYVADVMAKKTEPGIEICTSAEDFCIVMPVRSRNSIRLIGLVPEASEKKDDIIFSDVSESILRNTQLHPATVNWFSTYHIHHRVADHFQQGHVFLLGDAAHIHSPAGGQGMNTGIGDAVNLAWKLADILKGRADAALLNTYETERLAFAKTLVATTDRLFQIMASRSRGGKFWRTIIFPIWVPIAFKFKFITRFMFKLISQIRINYHDSTLSAGRAGKVRGGDRLPWVQQDGTDNYAPLTSLDWQVHVYGKADESLRLKLSEKKIPLHVFSWNNATENAGFKQDAVYLIRPDGYVAVCDELASGCNLLSSRFLGSR